MPLPRCSNRLRACGPETVPVAPAAPDRRGQAQLDSSPKAHRQPMPGAAACSGVEAEAVPPKCSSARRRVNRRERASRPDGSGDTVTGEGPSDRCPARASVAANAATLQHAASGTRRRGPSRRSSRGGRGARGVRQAASPHPGVPKRADTSVPKRAWKVMALAKSSSGRPQARPV